MHAVQRTFDDLGTPLVETTFCVVDLETTGGSPATCSITEIGAVKVRGGEVLGEFQTLVNPREPIPPFISALTGITDAMVAGAVTIDEALPSFLEFAGSSVLVAHNAGFDTRFLRTASQRLGYGILDNDVVCTVRLARRLVRDEVPNLRLETLAHALHSRFEPCHRALADARATTDVLHSLLELAGRWGVTHIDDLLWFQSAGGHPQARKRVVTKALPRAMGVYLFVDASDRVLYVGKATDLRTRVRSYFGADDRRSIGPLLREMADVKHIVTRCDLESLVLESRLIRAHRPPHNRVGRGRAPTAWVRFTKETFPRLSIGRTPGGIGPLTSAVAETLREALESVAPVRRCSERISVRTRFAACALAEIGRCAAPCEGRIDPATYQATISPIGSVFDGDPSLALDALERQMARLSEVQRYEEAAGVRHRIGSLVSAIARQRTAAALIEGGDVIFDYKGARLTVSSGRLVSVNGEALPVPADDHPDEPRLIASWLARHRPVIRAAGGTYAMPVNAGRTLAVWQRRLKEATR
ncbi:MAG: DEDD exonuclease domain-containing protein [Actinomycetota bacterium]|nr:DEDD exonuclease domain-containing protein [Actinomycetota bacterium]